MGRIVNDNQLKITESKIEDFKKTISESRKKMKSNGIDSKGIDMLISPMKFMMEQMKFEVNEYKKIKNGYIPKYLLSFDKLGELIIVLRIKNGLTQKELGDKIGVAQSQVARNEFNEYHGTSLGNLKKIIKMLEPELKIKV